MITSKQILQTVSDYFDIPVELITGKSRLRQLVYTRAVAAYLMRDKTFMSYPEVARAMGMGSHTTAKAAHDRIASGVYGNERTVRDVNALIKLIDESEVADERNQRPNRRN